MTDTAVHLEQRVLPEVPLRQWVCSLPWRLRYLCGYDRKLCSEVASAFVGEMFRSLRRRAKRLLGLASVTDAHPGAVAAVHRADSALRLNVHFHVLALDGVYIRRSPDGPLVFRALPTPTHAEVADVARRTADRIEKMGHDPRTYLKLRVGLFGGEPWSEELRREIETRLDIVATDNYGLSEIVGPGVAGECLCRKGMHIFEDHFLPEIIDPETGEVLPPGQKGELVLTNIVQEAIPLIRYRTRDITRLHYEPCDCGRTLVRMEKTMGRSDDMLIIKGVNVFPTQIEEVLFQVEGCEPHYLLVVEREGTLDTLEVQVEVNENIFFDEMKKQRAFIEMIEKRLATNIGLHAKIKLVEPSSMPRHEGKANRIIDKRNK